MYWPQYDSCLVQKKKKTLLGRRDTEIYRAVILAFRGRESSYNFKGDMAMFS
jgi:hypothetical protein